MRKQGFLRISVCAGAVLLCCCTPSQKHVQQKGYTSGAGAEFRKLYEAANSEEERRAVCLRAIDEALVDRGEPVSKVDEIFGTHFSSELPDQKEAARHAFIFFADQTFLPRRPDGKAEGVSYMGSYMDLDYDSNGAIQNYHLSNLHKGGSRRTNGKRPISVAELKQLYEIEKSERERRDVALRALDEAVIQTFGPINISTIDEIFGTHLASQLPTKKEGKRIGVVDFSSPVPISPNPAVKTEAAGKNGWFMAVEYDYNGNIQNYYLTNVHM